MINESLSLMYCERHLYPGRQHHDLLNESSTNAQSRHLGGKNLGLQKVLTPDLQTHEIRIAPRATGIYGSD